MWRTNFKHGPTGLETITHHFGHRIQVVVLMREKTVQRIHGQIIVGEWASADMSVDEFHKLLISIQQEIESK